MGPAAKQLSFAPFPWSSYFPPGVFFFVFAPSPGSTGSLGVGAAARCPPAVAITCGSLGLGRWQRLLLLVLWGFLPPNSWCVLLWEREEAENSPSLLYPVPWRRQSPGVLHFGEGKLRPSPMGASQGHGFLVCSSKKLILFSPGVFCRILRVGFFFVQFFVTDEFERGACALQGLWRR